MNNNIIPLFKSHYSIGRSILTVDKAENELKENKPISIFSIAKYYKLPEVYISDSSFTGFIETYESVKDLNIPIRFGYQVICCADIEDKSEKSFETEHKIIIWMKNSDAYKSLIKISSKAATDGFFYIPRIDYKNLKSLWSDDLLLTIPFYDNFLHNNCLKGSRCIFQLEEFKPVFFIEDNGLPFDSIIKEKILNYCQSNKLEYQDTQSIFYHKRKDFLSYLTFRAINNRSTLNKPQLSHMSSDNFCFESWLEKTNYGK